jgi:hypothetical protein
LYVFQFSDSTSKDVNAELNHKQLMLARFIDESRDIKNQNVNIKSVPGNVETTPNYYELMYTGGSCLREASTSA